MLRPTGSDQILRNRNRIQPYLKGGSGSATLVYTYMKYNGVLRILILQKHNIIYLYYIENRAIFGQKNAIVKETERRNKIFTCTNLHTPLHCCQWSVWHGVRIQEPYFYTDYLNILNSIIEEYNIVCNYVILIQKASKTLKSNA